MKVFVISLKNSKRREFIQTEFERLNLNFEFIDAIYGKNLSNEEKLKLCDMDAINSSPKWLNPGAIGCALSHHKAYEKMVSEEVEKAIIMEDDMILNDDFCNLLNFFEKNSSIDNIVLIYYRAFSRVRFSSHKTNSLKIDDKFSILTPCKLNDIPITTGCYFITQNEAKSLYHSILPIRVAADSWEYFYKQSIISTLQVVYPRPLTDAGLQSEIEYVDTYSSPIVKILKKALNIINNKFIDSLLAKKRKRLESQMSVFELSNQKSELSLKR